MKQFNYRVLIPLFLVIACGYCFAQNSPDAVFKSKIVPPSPEAASLGKYGQYPVTLNNGLVNISLPIYDITAGQLHLPISLSYHAAGVRAYDVSSCVGLGWTLNAGGAITRSILGFPDESTIGMLNNPFPDPTDAGETFQCFIGNVANSAGQIMGLDSQADLFSYSLNGSGGKFVFKSMPSTGMPWQILTTPATPVKITGDFTQFTIVDLDGTTYIFGQPERSVVQTDMGSLSDGPTAWYVTSIISTNKADTINFSYTTVSQIVSVQANNSLSVREDSYSSLVSTVALSQSSTVTTHYSVNIQQITYRGGKVLFEYATDRVDVPNGKRLTDIRIFNNVGGQYSEMKRFNFSQSYFIATSATEISQTDFLHVITPGARNNRLRLDSFYEQGYDGATISNPPYQFSYDPGQGFAVYGSTAQDFMGYYNGAIGNLNLLYYGLGNTNFGPTFSTQFGANRLVNPAYMKAGSLTKITYPTGGYTSFEMEPNQINYTKTTSVPNSVYYNYQLTSMVPSVYQGYQVSFTLTPAMTNNNDSIQTQFDVNVINDKQGQPTISTSIGVFDVTSQTYATVVNQYGIPVGTAVVGITSLTTEIIQSYYVILLKGHTYTLSYGSGFPNTTNEIHTMVSWYAPTGSYSTINTNETDYTGGLRIKSITNFDGINPVTKKGYVYTKWYYNSNLFNGDIPMLLDKFKSSCIRMWSPGSGVAYQRITYDAYGENVTFQIASSASLTASYEEVEEYDLDQSGNSLGKTVYTFNKRVDYISRLWPAFRSDEEWKRGQVSDVRVYRSSPISGQYILVKETSNIYNDSLSYSSKNFVSRLSNSVDVPGTSGLYDMVPYKECSGVNSYNVYDWAELDQEVYVSNLASTTTTTYDENGLTPQTTVAQYFYDNAKHGQLTRTLKDGSDSKT